MTTLTQDAFIATLERRLGLPRTTAPRRLTDAEIDDPAARAAYIASLSEHRAIPPRRRSAVGGRKRRMTRDEFITSIGPNDWVNDPAKRAAVIATIRREERVRDLASRAQKAPAGAASTTRGRPLMPKTDLYRGLVRFPAARGRRVTELRSADDGPPVMEGHFATFNDWTEIDSLWEGNFMESIAPGAFKKTFRESAQSIRALFQHGRDPVIGNKPLGSIDTLEEDDIGAHYVVPLFDTSYNADLIPALRAGVYGASFRFSVIQESIDNEPKKSAMNPNGIPQRTILELRLFEFGPVTFPAYASATAGLRSLSDEFRRAA